MKNTFEIKLPDNHWAKQDAAWAACLGAVFQGCSPLLTLIQLVCSSPSVSQWCSRCCCSPVSTTSS